MGGDVAGDAGVGVVPPGAADPVAAPYVDGFCLRVATGSGGGTEFYRLLATARARPLPDAAGAAAAPGDEPVAGQAFRFEGDVNAPTAFVEPRRGTCALVYPGANLPAAPLAELADDRPATGADGAPQRWRKVTAAFVGRPRPPRWFLQVGATEGQGVCADALTDLRRRTGEPVSLLRLAPCRPDAHDKVEVP